MKLGKCATGITQGKDGYLYVNASEYGEEGWLKYGGAVYKVDKELKSYKEVTGLFKGINGLCTDDRGNLYFAIGDLEFFFPDGAIYKMSYNQKLKKYNQAEMKYREVMKRFPDSKFKNMAKKDVIKYIEID